MRLGDQLLAALEPHTSPLGARIYLPGRPGVHGADVAGLEGFARSFLLAGYRLSGERGADPTHLAERYARGLVAGTDPTSTERWPSLIESKQARVEAACLALVLDLTRTWIWDRLSTSEQDRVVHYLSDSGQVEYSRSNWVWFRLLTQTFLRSVGGTHSTDAIKADLATHDDFVRAHGWISDGGGRNFDHYAGWALHLFPALWARMQGAQDLSGPRAGTDRARLASFLTDLVHLVGADGGPLIQGRSLIYRFAAAAPFWVGALEHVDTVPLGQLRRAAAAQVAHFVAHGAPDERGLLTLGWHHPWRPMAQNYSSPGSPYWASHGMLGLALPAEHPVWADDDVALPAQEPEPTLRALQVPGWALSTADGVVRVSNHGTDHDRPGSVRADSPLYARLGYSTATAPLMDQRAATHPTDQAVVLLDTTGRRSHRAGMELGQTTIVTPRPGEAPAAVAASRGQIRWLPPELASGSGPGAAVEPAATLEVLSLLRGPWEVRLFRFTAVADQVIGWEAGGWPLAGATPPEQTLSQHPDQPSAHLVIGRLSSTVVGISGTQRAWVSRHTDASPLGHHAAVPGTAGEVDPGRWHALAILLRRGGDHAGPHRAPSAGVVGVEVAVEWVDGERTTTGLPFS